MNDNSAVKNDYGKLRFDLVPVEPLRRLVEVYTIGSTKYEDRNWEKGLRWGRIYAAMLRHATAWWSGEQLDQTDGQHHLASVAWCAFALMEFEYTHPDLDDRTTFRRSSEKSEELDDRPKPHNHKDVVELDLKEYFICRDPEKQYEDSVLKPFEIIKNEEQVQREFCMRNLKQGTD